MDISCKIEKQLSSLQLKITGLSGTYATNTWKRQQQQLERDRKIAGYRAQLQILEYLAREADTQPLTKLETALTTSAFYETMVSYSKRNQMRLQSSTCRPLAYPDLDSPCARQLAKGGIVDLDKLMTAIRRFDELVRAAVP